MGPESRESLTGARRCLQIGTVLLLLGVGAPTLAGGELAAQTPPPPDSIQVSPDTVPPLDGDSIPADTLKPVTVVAPFRPGAEPRWTAGVWEWDREALLRSSGLTLTELLAGIPGVTPIRSGFIGHPEAAAIPGGVGGHLELYLDGFALDPLDGATYDLSRLELVELSRVRVERRGGGLRIDLETVAPTDHRPFSMVEAGTGEYGARMVRGTFMTPDFIVGPLALGIERVEGSGVLRSQPANTFAGWFKWTRGFGATTLQLEHRRNTIEWTNPQRVSMKGHRNDWVARIRREITPGLTTEAFLGGSGIEDLYADSTVERHGLQGGVRALYRGDAIWATATLRGREQELLPRTEADLAAGIRLPGRTFLSGDLALAGWRDGREARSWTARAEFEPITGIRPFAEWGSGEYGIDGLWAGDPFPPPDPNDPAADPLTSRATLIERTMGRAGIELGWRGARLGAALIQVDTDSIADFGLPFDGTGTLFPGGRARGLEVNGRIPLLWDPLWVEGWYAYWPSEDPWIYLPETSLRTALVYQDSPLASGNLEISARLELSHRGRIPIPALIDPDAGPGGGTAIDLVPGIASLDFYLQIRVLDLRAFVRWNNITHRLDQQDLPGRIFPGQRAFYGVKWQFWN